MSSAWFVNLGSVWRGMRVRDRTKRVRWSVERLSPVQRGRFWCHLWTPTWHCGRGPYVSVGLYWIAIYRGY